MNKKIHMEEISRIKVCMASFSTSEHF